MVCVCACACACVCACTSRGPAQEPRRWCVGVRVRACVRVPAEARHRSLGHERLCIWCWPLRAVAPAGPSDAEEVVNALCYVCTLRQSAGEP